MEIQQARAQGKITCAEAGEAEMVSQRGGIEERNRAGKPQIKESAQANEGKVKKKLVNFIAGGNKCYN